MYESPRLGLSVEDCFFYHTIELPGLGLIEGHWDLRAIASAYLGSVDFNGQRVLEVGPASGFLTAHMDKAGADVVALEKPAESIWDFAPVAIRDEDWSRTKQKKHANNDALKNSFWLTHERLGLRAQALYRDLSDLPEAAGRFDTAVLAMVLTHMRDPVAAIETCARRAERLIITDRCNVPDALQEQPVMSYIPHKSRPQRRDTWWYFSRGFFRQALEAMGFSKITFSEVDCPVRNGNISRATVVVAEW